MSLHFSIHHCSQSFLRLVVDVSGIYTFHCLWRTRGRSWQHWTAQLKSGFSTASEAHMAQIPARRLLLGAKYAWCHNYKFHCTHRACASVCAHRLVNVRVHKITKTHFKASSSKISIIRVHPTLGALGIQSRASNWGSIFSTHYYDQWLPRKQIYVIVSVDRNGMCMRAMERKPELPGPGHCVEHGAV